MTEYVNFALAGGLDLESPISSLKPGSLRTAKNIECKIGGGYRRIRGYTKFDDNEIAGTGSILGIHQYNDKVYAFREVEGGGSVTMWESTGSGWTAKKTGLTTGGTYEFINAVIGGSTQKMYGVSGVDKAFMWDGSTYTELTTGMTTDTPEHIAAHRNHLFLSFGRSVQNSSIGDPTSWNPITGGSEMAMDSPVTAMHPLQGGVLGIFSRDQYSLLYGTSTADFTKEKMANPGMTVGALPHTIQSLGARTRFVDDQGVIDLAQAEAFGAFADNMVSRPVQTYLRQYIISDDITDSCVVRSKSQYRLFFNDGRGLIFVFVGEKLVGITEMDFPNIVRCVSSEELSDGSERIVFGSDTGYVYTLESGGLFDATEITAVMTTTYSAFKTPTFIKRFRRVSTSARSPDNVTLYVRPEAVFADKIPLPHEPTDFTLYGSGGVLGESFLGTAILTSSAFADGRAEINSHGEYLSLVFFSTTSSEGAWELDDLIITFDMRRRRRG